MGSIAINFSTPVSTASFNLQSLSLSLNGANVPLTGSAASLAPNGSDTLNAGGTPCYASWTLSGLSGLTATGGTYQLNLAKAGIADYLDESLLSGASARWVMSTDTIQSAATTGQSIRIAVDASTPADADVYINSATAPTYVVPLSQVSQWSITGGSGTAVTLDFSNGDPVPQGDGLAFIGDAATNNDSLLIKDTSGNADSVMVTPTEVTVNGQTFAYSSVPNVTVDLSGQQNSLTINGASVDTNVPGANFAGTAVAVTNGGTINLGGLTTAVGSVSLINGTIVNGTFQGSAGRLVQSGSISAGLAGSGALLKNTSGTVVLSGSNNYTGTTVVAAGKLVVANANGLPSGASLYVGALETTVAVTASANPSTIGQLVTFTATVAGTVPVLAVPTGTVTFMEGNTTLGTAVVGANGQASFSTSALPGGSDTIAASYGGDGTFAASSGSLPETVTKATTTTAVVSSVNPSVYGQSVTFTVTVSGTSPLGATPTGTVVFQDGSTTLGTTPLSANEQAAFTTSALVVGNHTITASYGGDGNFQASSSSGLTETVNRAAITTSLTSSSNSFVYGQQVTLTATVTVTYPGSGTPTGTVTFISGSTAIGSSPLSGGTAVLNTTAVPAGSNTLTAVYGRDGVNFFGSTSPGISATVAWAPLTITANNATKVYGAALPDVVGQLLGIRQRRHLCEPHDAADPGPQRYVVQQRRQLFDHSQRSGRLELHDYLRRRDADRQPRPADDHGQQRHQGLRGRAADVVGQLLGIRQRRHFCEPHDAADPNPERRGVQQRRQLFDRSQRSGRLELHDYLRRRDADRQPRPADDHGQQREQGLRRRLAELYGQLCRVRQRRHVDEPDSPAGPNHYRDAR